MKNNLRRQLLKAGLSSGILSCLPRIGFAQGTSRYLPYKGQKIVACWPSDYPSFQIAKKIIPQFTQQSGIEVELDEMPYVKMKGEIIDSAVKSNKYDFAAYIAPWKSELAQKKCLTELTPLFQNKSLADPKFDMGDLIPGQLTNIGLVGGRLGYLDGPNAKLYGIPRGGETSILAYRKDVFDKYKVKPPVDYKAFNQLIAELADKSKSPVMTQRLMKGHHCVHSWLLHLNPLGGQVFDDQWQSTINQSAGVEALNFLKLVKDTGPQGIDSFGFSESANAFLSGDANIYLDSTMIFAYLRKPENAEIAKKVGFSLHPRGVKYASATAGFGCGVMENAKNKHASFLFLEWLTNKEQDAQLTRMGGAPNRVSTLYRGDLLREVPHFDIYQKQLLHATPNWRPIIPQWDELNLNYLGVYIPRALNNELGSQEALTECSQKITPLMKQWGYT